MNAAADDVGLGGIPIRRTSLDRAVDEFLDRVAGGGSPTTYRFVNAYTVALADQDARYHELLSSGGVNLPDGAPVAALVRRVHRSGPTCEQVRGPSFFELALDRGRERSVRHYFLGGSPATLAAVVRNAEDRFPGITIAGSESPPFRALTPEEQQQQDALIRDSGASVVWVGLGTPKQDAEAARITTSAEVTTAAVGAAFDFFAGHKRQAPEVMRRWHLEWLFRLLTEPRRLWRRYLFGNTRFLRVMVRELRGG